jgi:hypothetical protein
MTIPEGWQLVPKVPTPEMVSAMYGKLTTNIENNGNDLFDSWKAALAAAPQPPTESAPQETNRNTGSGVVHHGVKPETTSSLGAADPAPLSPVTPKRTSFAEAHPRNPDAKCKCEHWQSCAECHPTAHLTPEPLHNDHPLRHWDRTCPACIAEEQPVEEFCTLSYDRYEQVWDTSCGSYVNQVHNFCPKCGKKIREVTK